MTNFFQGWLQNSAAQRDSIDLKRVYIDMCGGNFYDAVMFSQIMFWHEPKKNGETKLKIYRDGHYWLAKRLEDWYEECRINANTARGCIDRLTALGLVIKQTFHFEGRPVMHLRVDPERFEALVNAAQNGILEQVRKQFLSDGRPQIPDDGKPQIVKSPSIRGETSNPIDATPQIEVMPDLKCYTEITDSDDDIDSPSLEENHHQVPAASWTEDERVIIFEALRPLGLAERIREQLAAQEPEYALALVYLATARGTTNPAGLLVTLLQSKQQPPERYLKDARAALHPSSILQKPDENECAALRKMAHVNCPDCQGRGWVDTYDPRAPWAECWCVLEPDERHNADPACPDCQGHGWVRTFRSDMVWKSCTCVTREGSPEPLVRPAVPAVEAGAAR